MRAITFAAAAAVALASTAVAAPAAAVERISTCGAVVSGEAVLARSLTCTEGDGITLLPGASLDLNTRTLAGHRDGRGIVLPASGDVSVRRGTITGWGNGIALAEPDESDDASGGTTHVHRVTLRDNAVGVEATTAGFGSPGITVAITSSRLEHNDVGLAATLSSSFDVSGSALADNGTGVRVISSGITVRDSRMVRNGTAVSCDESYCLLERATVSDNGAGIDVRSSGAVLRDSTLDRNTVAVTGFASWGAIEMTGNVLRKNGTAVRLDNASSSLVDNAFVDNGVGYTADGDPFFTGYLEGNVLRRNGDGIASVIEGTQLKGNTSYRNTGWGIHAPGAVDLGGNTAYRNGNEPQCVGVVCGGPVS